jgi:DNA-binding response OmpR family regulator
MRCMATRAWEARKVTRVLLADMDSPQRAVLQSTLTNAGYAVSRATSLAELQTLISRSQFQLIVCDVNLHPRDTRVLVESVYARLIDATPVVIVSDERLLSQRLIALRAGASDFSTKTAQVTLLTRPLAGIGAPLPVASPCRVLVVDDSTTYGNALADELSLDGHDVVLAPSAGEANDYLSFQTPDFILLDVFLPDGDGVDIARRLRSNAATRELPILMLTGRESANIRRRAAEAQVSGFAAKDTPLYLLRKTVRELAKPRRLRPSRTSLGAVEARPSMPTDLLSRVVQASGLSEVLGRSTIDRALQRAGIDAVTLTPGKLKAALPQIEQALATFLVPQDARLRVAAITVLAMESAVTP